MNCAPSLLLKALYREEAAELQGNSAREFNLMKHGCVEEELTRKIARATLYAGDGDRTYVS